MSCNLEKVFAPKPIRKTSNYSGFRLETSFEIIHKTISSSTRIPKAKLWSKQRIFPSEHKSIIDLMNALECEDERQVDVENAKLEIFLILGKTDSTGHSSTVFNIHSDNCLNKFNLKDLLLRDDGIMDDVRISLPPHRTNKPFQNLEENVDNDSLNIAKYNSSNDILKRGSVKQLLNPLRVNNSEL